MRLLVPLEMCGDFKSFMEISFAQEPCEFLSYKDKQEQAPVLRKLMFYGGKTLACLGGMECIWEGLRISKLVEVVQGIDDIEEISGMLLYCIL